MPTAIPSHTMELPFNVDCLGGDFVSSKGRGPAPSRSGYWLIVQGRNLVLPEDPEPVPPLGDLPSGFDGLHSVPLWLGDWRGTPCWAVGLPRDAPLPAGFRRENMAPAQGTWLPDDLLSLGGIAMQALWWESTSGFCPRCGTGMEPIESERGKRCPGCRYEHYPHLHPAVIVLVRDGDRVLLARKPGTAPGRYTLIAGFVDNGESLEGAVRREIKEEVGVEVDEIQYVGSQNWPFPSQLMVGFVARYAGGEIAIDRHELEDARWFPRNALPPSPSRHTISAFILEHYARLRPRRGNPEPAPGA